MAPGGDGYSSPRTIMVERAAVSASELVARRCRRRTLEIAQRQRRLADRQARIDIAVMAIALRRRYMDGIRERHQAVPTSRQRRRGAPEEPPDGAA